MRYHLQRDGNLFGPFSEAEIRELMASGALTLLELAAPEGSTAFQELRLLFPVQPLTNSFESTGLPEAGQPNVFEPAIPSRTAPVIPLATAPEIPPAVPDNRPSPITEALATAATYHPKTVSDLINDSYDITREKALSWLILLLVPIAISALIFVQSISSSFDSMKDEIAKQMVQIPRRPKLLTTRRYAAPALNPGQSGGAVHHDTTGLPEYL
jgi:hypothetical protein